MTAGEGARASTTAAKTCTVRLVGSGGGQSINVNNREKPSNDLRKLGSQAKSSGCDLLKISVKSCTLGPKTPTVLDGMTAEDMERDLFVVE